MCYNGHIGRADGPRRAATDVAAAWLYLAAAAAAARLECGGCLGAQGRTVDASELGALARHVRFPRAQFHIPPVQWPRANPSALFHSLIYWLASGTPHICLPYRPRIGDLSAPLRGQAAGRLPVSLPPVNFLRGDVAGGS